MYPGCTPLLSRSNNLDTARDHIPIPPCALMVRCFILGFPQLETLDRNL